MCKHYELLQCSTIVFDALMSKFGRNSDQTSTPQCRSLVEVWSKFGRSLVEVWCRSLVDILSKLQCVYLIYSANFDQTSTLGVSQFGRSLVEVWSKFGRSFDTGVSKFGRYNIDTFGVFLGKPSVHPKLHQQ